MCPLGLCAVLDYSCTAAVCSVWSVRWLLAVWQLVGLPSLPGSLEQTIARGGYRGSIHYHAGGGTERGGQDASGAGPQASKAAQRELVECSGKVRCHGGE